ncbi:MAG: methylenetetrahydrofolate reductase [NAD(P)H] [Lachnospiraceae bacterium]|jgi:methylenetetrahydrofolate reductase (NADPH)|nr:methylenetetrahydrofolate reductase [NAD(P)H] [Lachnospiraceae bacterium]
MKVSEIYGKKQNKDCPSKKSLSFEIFPPKKDSELKNIDETLAVLCELEPDYISVTFGAGGSANCNRTIELAKRIKREYHVEPVVHLTCLHYNKAEIDEFANILTDAGLQNVLALRGDKNPNIAEKEDFRHASDLIAYMKAKWDFCFLGACYPECHPESDGRISDVKYLKTKVSAGAEVLLSQLFFDNKLFFRFQEDCRIADINTPIIPGIMPVINASQIRRMITMCGATFPVRFQKIIHKYEDNKEALFDAGMSYALSQIIDLLVNDIDGIHLYTMNNPLVARRICEGIRNII